LPHSCEPFAAPQLQYLAAPFGLAWSSWFKSTSWSCTGDTSVSTRAPDETPPTKLHVTSTTPMATGMYPPFWDCAGRLDFGEFGLSPLGGAAADPGIEEAPLPSSPPGLGRDSGSDDDEPAPDQEEGEEESKHVYGKEATEVDPLVDLNAYLDSQRSWEDMYGGMPEGNTDGAEEARPTGERGGASSASGSTYCPGEVFSKVASSSSRLTATIASAAADLMPLMPMMPPGVAQDFAMFAGPLATRPSRVSSADSAGEFSAAAAAGEPLAVPFPGEAAPTLGSAAMPTIGSQGHFNGTCKPCAFVNTKGCKDGEQCNFCHLCEPGEKKRRKKVKNMQRKSRVYMDRWVEDHGRHVPKAPW